MAIRPEITPELCRELLRYDPETGKLYYRQRSREWFAGDRACSTWNARHAGAEALSSAQAQGYKQGRFFGRCFRSHRVAWAVFHGEWPRFHLDHINGDRTDDRIVNLRDVPPAEINRNSARPVTNTSGVVGVVWCKKTRKWQARIVANGIARHLGYFEEFNDAVKARLAGEQRYGFSGGHGKRVGWASAQ